MKISEMNDCLERSPVIAAIHEQPSWEAALESPPEIFFYLKANLMTVAEHIKDAHMKGKRILIHMDLAEGIGRDRTGIDFLAGCGADGIISTRGQMIRYAKEAGLFTIQRFFALDSQGIGSINESIELSKPDMIEIMPGVIGKIIKRFSMGTIPVIAGGLIETKNEVTDAIRQGAVAVSTGNQKLWYV